MTTTISRSELHRRVWSEPMRDVARRFGVSDVAMRKACLRAQVPTPPQGHWNKVAAGKRAVTAALSLRPPGMSPDIHIGGGGPHWYRPWTQEELLGPVPPPPEFDESLEAVRARIEAGICKIVCPRRDGARHPAIRKLLDQDEARARKAADDGYVFSWNQPRFQTPFERRRLEILNSLFLAMGRYGAKATVRGDQAREITVSIDAQHVGLSLDRRPTARRGKSSSSDPNALTFAILTSAGGSEVRASWSDGDGCKLETRLTTIASEVVFAAEVQLREGAERLHKWRIERKAQIEEEDRQRAIERARREAEELKRLEAARIDSLLKAADDFRKAQDIRDYVAALATAVDREPDRRVEYDSWSVWALAQADRIDPARTGRFNDPPSEAGELA